MAGLQKVRELTVDTMIPRNFSRNEVDLKTIYFYQGDINSAKFLLNITHEGAEQDLSTATKVQIAFLKPDGKRVFQDCSNVNPTKGKYYVVLDTQSIAAAGKVIAQIRITFPDTVVETTKFVFSVEESIMSDEAVESSDEFPAIQKAIEAGEKLEGVDIPALVASKETAEQALAKSAGNTDQIGILSKDIGGRGINVFYPPAPLVAAKGDGIFDDTAIFQAIANVLPADGELFIPKGTFLIGQVNFPNGRQNIKIRGNGTIKSKVGNYTANFVFGQYTYYVEITGLTFIGLKDQTGAPTTYTPDKNAIIKINDGCGYFKIEKNRFLDHMGHFIVLGAITGNDVEMGHTIEKNVFRNMVDLNDNRQCAILMRSNCQYSEVINNKFYNCQSAIHSLSANNKINYNNIEGGTLNIVGLPPTPKLSDYFDAKQGWIVCSFEGDPVVYNSAKTQIIGNKINHLNGNAPALLCEGSFSRNEGYFDISNNEMLINKCDYSIMLKQNAGTRMINNSIGNTVANAHKAHVAIFESKSITLDKNHYIGDCKTAVLEGAEFYDGVNTFDKMPLNTPNYEYITNANVTNKRRPRVLNYTFACIDGSKTGLAQQHTANTWTYAKNAVGNYTVTHNIGHTSYAVNITGDNRIVCIKNMTANSFDIFVYSLSGGTAQDGYVYGTLTLSDNRHAGYYNLTTIPERIL